MSWTIERRERVAVVTMTTNPVNAQNQAFFADLHDAFDRLEHDHPDSPVVLTGTGRRIAVPGDATFGLNEVPIGIPMPAVYVRMLAYAWGGPVAARTSLLGEIFTPAQAHALGMVRELVPANDLLDRAVAIAGQVPEDCLDQYAFTKRACQAAALRDIAALADPLDTELPQWMTSEHARHAHRRYWQQLKGRPADW